jgi:hypothetical protein
VADGESARTLRPLGDPDFPKLDLCGQRRIKVGGHPSPTAIAKREAQSRFTGFASSLFPQSVVGESQAGGSSLN